MVPHVKISPVHSIRIRVLILVAALVVAATSLLSWYVLGQFEAATAFELQQAGILLSDALEASIIPAAAAGDISALQTHIDRLVATRERNDIEINIMLLEGDTSATVASNIPDNIEETDPEEHRDLLASLAHQSPVVFIGRDDDDEGLGEDEKTDLSPSNPDYYFSRGQRFLSITTPLSLSDRKLGSINLKLSLARVDQELVAIRWALQLAIIVELILLIGGLALLLNVQIFNPLWRMAHKMHTIAGGDLSQRIGYENPLNEIGWVANTFDQMIGKLQAAFEREKRFTADVSHELRTPLTALKGRIGLALTQPRSPAEYERTLQKLEKEVDRLGRLSNDLLFLARLEQGQLRPHLEEQAFGDLLGAIVDQMQPLAEEKGICLVEQIAPNLTLRGDADHLIRLFINLLDNAIKYSPTGGQVNLSAERSGRYIQVAIRDSGPGIAPEHQARLFDRFYRLEADRSRDSGGAGLGLAIAAEIVRGHRGEIELQSQLEQGATFTVYLPVS